MTTDGGAPARHKGAPGGASSIQGLMGRGALLQSGELGRRQRLRGEAGSSRGAGTATAINGHRGYLLPLEMNAPENIERERGGRDRDTAGRCTTRAGAGTGPEWRRCWRKRKKRPATNGGLKVG
jgi:hypothetical protein